MVDQPTSGYSVGDHVKIDGFGAARVVATVDGVTASVWSVLRNMKEVAASGDEVMCAACLSESALEIAVILGIDLG